MADKTYLEIASEEEACRPQKQPLQLLLYGTFSQLPSGEMLIPTTALKSILTILLHLTGPFAGLAQ